jgi:hypothetical protein
MRLGECDQIELVVGRGEQRAKGFAKARQQVPRAVPMLRR